MTSSAAISLTGCCVAWRATCARVAFEQEPDKATTGPASPRQLALVPEIAQYERTRQQMKTLSGIGFGFALGEFGSGSQSFAYLKGLPVDYLRIDCHCYAEAEAESLDRLTVEYLVGVARTLGIERFTQTQ